MTTTSYVRMMADDPARGDTCTDCSHDAATHRAYGATDSGTPVCTACGPEYPHEDTPEFENCDECGEERPPGVMTDGLCEACDAETDFDY